MLKYAMQTGRMNEMMELLFRVLDIRITFFDLQASEVEGFNIKQMSAFRRHRRKDEAFDARCRECDREHLRIAKQSGGVHIYHCHAGLLEGIVPMYDRHRQYLGAIVFGQLRDRSHDVEASDKTSREFLRRTRESTLGEMRDIGALLKYMSEYIIENEIVQYRNKPWVERVEHYIDDHFAERITVDGLAEVIGRSASFLSHNFPKEFGVSLKAYILDKRMVCARERLLAGDSVRSVAEALGFYDEFHFSKKFKQYYGASPRNYLAGKPD